MIIFIIFEIKCFPKLSVESSENNQNSSLSAVVYQFIEKLEKKYKRFVDLQGSENSVEAKTNGNFYFYEFFIKNKNDQPLGKV